LVTEKEIEEVKELAKKVKVKLIKDDKSKITPHKLGKRDLKELLIQMKYYVDFLKKRKGVKVILKEN